MRVLTSEITSEPMANLKSRTRVVYFRISEEEFTELCDLREARGARSLSELARTAVYAMMQPDAVQSGGIKEELSERLQGVERCLAEMNHHLKTLTKSQAQQEVYRGSI